MLDGFIRLLPDAEVGFAGLVRDEATAQASWYAERLPDDASGRATFVLDPMLATGGDTGLGRRLAARPKGRVGHLRLPASPHPRASTASRRSTPATT